MGGGVGGWVLVGRFAVGVEPLPPGAEQLTGVEVDVLHLSQSPPASPAVVGGRDRLVR